MRVKLPYYAIRTMTLVTVVVLISSLPVLAQDDYKPVHNPTLHVQRAPGEISIDGKLDDAGWRNAAVADHFVENSPGDQIRPPVETRGYVTYDDGNLYVAVVCYDNPEDIRASLCERDRVYDDDNVGFFFDTYGDASWGYTLNVNPHGIQGDALWTNGFGEDSQFDLVWESAGQITDSGYQVEMAIPFTSLRFPNQEKQVWKVEFWRHHQRSIHHQMSWSAYDRNESCWACQWGAMTGIENVKPGRGVEIVPAFTGFQSGTLVEDESTQALNFDNDNVDGELSLNAKYSISSNVTAEICANPDFSQVEADADQIDVNSTTALSFPEKRPFFQEGRDLFRTLYDVVYTRSINDPDLAAKATARFGRTSLAYLGAHDVNSPIILPFTEFSTPTFLGEKSTSNILRLRQTFGQNSQVGLLITDRRFEGGGSGTVVSADGSFKFSRSMRFRWQAIGSHTSEPDDTVLTANHHLDPFDDDDSTTNLNNQYFDATHTAGFDGESFWGHGYIGLLDYDASNFYISGRYSESSPTFRLDNGYEPRNDRRQASVNSFYTFRYDEGLVESIVPQVFAARIWNTGGQIKDEWVNVDLSGNLREEQISFHAQYLRSRENYKGVQFDGIWGLHNCLHVTPSRQIAFGGSINYGHRIARSDVTMGKETGLGLWLDIRPSDRVYIENRYNFLQSRQVDTDEQLYKGYTARSRVSIQFNRELTLRMVAQYNDFSETWDFDPLLTYQINPFTMFYIGTTYDYCKYYDLNDDGTGYVPDGETGRSATKLGCRQFFMKLQYLFQL